MSVCTLCLLLAQLARPSASAPPLQPEASFLSLCHSVSLCDKESLSLEPCHRSRKWFLPQVGGAEREGKRRETEREKER